MSIPDDRLAPADSMGRPHALGIFHAIFVPALITLLAVIQLWMPEAHAEDLSVSFTDRGVPELVLDGRRITDGRFSESLPRVRHAPSRIDYRFPMFGSWIREVSSKGKTIAGYAFARRFDPDRRVLVHEASRVRIARRYKVSKGSLDIHLTIQNTSDRVLNRLELPLLPLTLPGDSLPAQVTEKTFFGQAGRTFKAMNVSEPVVLPMRIKDRVLVAATAAREPRLSLRWAISRSRLDALRKQRRLERKAEHGDPNAQALADRHAENELDADSLEQASADYELRLRLGGGDLVWHERYMDWQLGPGQETKLVIHLRVGTANDPLAPAEDVLKAYAQDHPRKFEWPDRGPIVRSFLGDSLEPHPPEGPELTEPGVEVSDEFRERIMNHADQLIREMKSIDAQGMILWNVESNGGRLQYVGEPSMTPYISPKMDAVADAFFKKIRDAGFRVGVCLRPSDIVIRTNEKGEHFFGHTYKGVDVVENLHNDVMYAKERWGASLFYVDTNHVYAMPFEASWKPHWPRKKDKSFKQYRALMNAGQWQTLRERNPDSLFTVEHTYVRYYTAQAPYDQMNMGNLPGATVTPPLVKRTWPDAFKLLTLGNPVTKYQRKMRRAFHNGDVLVVNTGLESDAPFINLARREAEFLKEGAPSEVREADPEQLIELVSDSSAILVKRYHALRRLQRSETDIPPEVVVELCDDEAMAMRLKSIELVTDERHAAAARALAPYMHHINDPLHDVSVKAIRRIGDAAVGPLVRTIRAAERGAHERITGAVKGIAELESAAARKALIEMARDKNLSTLARRDAIRRLKRWGQHASVARAMRGLIDAGDQRVSIAAAGVLARRGGEKARKAIRERLEAERSSEESSEYAIRMFRQMLESAKKNSE